MDETKARAWCITVFVSDVVTLQSFVDSVGFKKADFAVAQAEIAPTTGREHVQAFVYFPNARSFKAVKDEFKIFNPHIEAAKGTVQDNVVYCTKVESRKPGTVPRWNARTLGGLMLIRDHDDVLFHRSFARSIHDMEGCTRVKLTYE